ncbi:MAG: PQQ-binding-like beta-propeller repeat protein [Planctomycetota bacterium]|nr:PQQ-binding-like beta-propeller repeat protein [Planctomycetota bacterium]
MAPNDPQPISTPRRSRSLSKWFWTLCLLAIATLFISRQVIYETDHQIANLAGILWGIIAFLMGVIALWLSRSIALKWKLALSALPLFALGAFYLCFEYTGVTGEVLPNFRLRSFLRSKPSVRPQRPEIQEASIPAELKSHRFSQFFGNDRSGIVDEPLFSMAWDLKLPTLVWRRPIGDGWSGFAVAQGIALTLEQIEQDEVLSAMSLSNGETLWRVQRPGRHYHPMGGLGPRSTPTIVNYKDQTLVVALTATGHLLCVELQTGSVRWERQLLEDSKTNQADFELAVNWGRAASPLVHKDRVIVPLGGAQNQIASSLMACSLDDGTVLWTQGKSQISYASPVVMSIHGVEQIVSVNEGDVTGHAWEDGQVLWTSPWPSNSNGAACASQPILIEADKILVGKGYSQGSKLFQVDLATEQTPKVQPDDSAWSTQDVWSVNKILKTKFTSSIYHDGKLFALSDGILECVDPADGSRIWRGQRYGQGQTLIVNGTLLVSSEDGRIVAVDPKSGKPIAEMNVLEGITWNTCAVAGPYLLVRNGSEAVCLTAPAISK